MQMIDTSRFLVTYLNKKLGKVVILPKVHIIHSYSKKMLKHCKKGIKVV